MGIVILFASVVLAFGATAEAKKQKNNKKKAQQQEQPAGGEGSLDCSKNSLGSDRKEYVYNEGPPDHINRSDDNYMQNYRCMVCNCFNEAGNQETVGQVAVGKVVMTRSRMTKTFPQASNRDDHSLCGIIKDKKQFSWLNQARTQRPVPKDHACFESMHEAMMFTDGVFADHYFNPKIVKPKWAKKMTKVASIGDHDFYINKQDQTAPPVKKKKKKKGKN